MPRKGMRTIFFKQTSPLSTPSQSPLHRSHHTFSDTLMEENFGNAQAIITKWDAFSSNNYCNITSLFSSENRQEAKQYLTSIRHLQAIMHHYISHQPTSEKLVKAQELMQIAMKRLEKEFYQILKSNRDALDPESVSSSSSCRTSVSELAEDENSDDDQSSGFEDTISDMEKASMIAMADLKSIAECMIKAGYAKECVKIYNIIRKSIVDESLYHLGVEKMSFPKIAKMDWEVVELRIKSWLHAVKVAVKTLFYGERILCDHVFSASSNIREASFTAITKEGAISLFEFPENVAKCKKSPEKMFRILDLYESISEMWPEIESIFGFDSTSNVRQQAVNSLIKLGDAVRTMLTDFETAIQKDNSKALVPGGGVHPLTRYVMNYITFLSDYTEILTDIIADSPVAKTVNSPLPEGYFGSPASDEYNSSPIAIKFAWLILVVLCKLDGKAENYIDVALSYLFLANNLQYVVNKVRSSNLRLLLGDEWILQHDKKIKQYAANYERMAWSKVFNSFPGNVATAVDATEVFKQFNIAFEEAYRRQATWIIQDSKLREEVKVSLARKVVPNYREFYEKYPGVVKRGSEGGIVKFAPEDLGNYLSDLLHGESGSVSSISYATSSFYGQSRGRRSH